MHIQTHVDIHNDNGFTTVSGNVILITTILRKEISARKLSLKITTTKVVVLW